MGDYSREALSRGVFEGGNLSISGTQEIPHKSWFHEGRRLRDFIRSKNIEVLSDVILVYCLPRICLS